ncbi:MAG: succinyl-diaminopimelate desuccinylase [Acidimicrobiales bacterium]
MSDLLARAFELVGVASVSRAEAELATVVEEELRRSPEMMVERVGDNVVASSSFGRQRRVILAGHLDTVPPFGDRAPRMEDGTLWGLGAVDMKGGLAVMLDLAAGLGRTAVDVTFVFYACEEIERSASGLGRLVRERPELLEADVAVLAEPTACVVEAGCEGTMRALVTVVGRRAHSARPQMGVNAVHRLEPLLRTLAEYEPRELLLDGCRYTEQLQGVGVSGGVAGNVVPDRASVTVNFRFAPDRDISAAEAELRRLLAGGLDEAYGDSLEILDAAPGAPPALDHHLLARLVVATEQAPRAKAGWTDVATFSRLGVPAVNFGPGDPSLAHTPDEHVSGAELTRARDVLSRFLSGT